MRLPYATDLQFGYPPFAADPLGSPSRLASYCSGPDNLGNPADPQGAADVGDSKRVGATRSSCTGIFSAGDANRPSDTELIVDQTVGTDVLKPTSKGSVFRCNTENDK